MAALRQALRLAVACMALCPAAGMHGFMDTLLHGRSSQAASHAEHNVGRTFMDALKLAFSVGTSDFASDGRKPAADKVFDHYDTRDPRSVLSTHESGAMLQDLGFTQDEVAQMQGEMDVDHDGYVNKEEFSDYIQVPEQVTEAPEAVHPSSDASPTAAPPEVAPSPQDAVVSKPEEPPVTAHEEPAPAPPALEPESWEVPALEAPTAPPMQPWKPPAEFRATPPPQPPSGRDLVGGALRRHSARTQDTLVDAFENAQLAEIKRSVFRSLGRLRSAQVREYDTIAKLETQAIDEYNDHHVYREENPLHYLSDEEEPVESDKFATFHSGGSLDDY